MELRSGAALLVTFTLCSPSLPFLTISGWCLLATLFSLSINLLSPPLLNRRPYQLTSWPRAVTTFCRLHPTLVSLMFIASLLFVNLPPPLHLLYICIHQHFCILIPLHAKAQHSMAVFRPTGLFLFSDSEHVQSLRRHRQRARRILSFDISPKTSTLLICTSSL